MKIYAIMFFAVLMSFNTYTQTAGSNPPKIEAGVSKELAVWRKSHYSDVRYKLDLTLEKMAPTLRGTIEVRVRVSGTRGIGDAATGGRGEIAGIPIVLDWRKISGHEALSKISNVFLNGKAVIPEEVSEHLVFSEGILDGENVIKLDFESPILKSGSAITRYLDSEDGAEYIYSLFVPSDASTAMPVFDQPDLKARFTLNITVPLEWKVVANSVLHSGRNIEPNKVLGFSETKPISTYVFAFAAGPFAEFSDESLNPIASGAEQMTPDPPVSASLRPRATSPAGNRVFVRKSQGEKFKPHAEEVFRLNREAIKYFEDYFDYKFPFPKYDVVLIPEFPFGGMEHAGATFLRERSVIFPTEPTANDYISRASVIFHEAAHQWFGDTVTMEWFDDLWLKEGFATFMAYKAMSEVLPQYDAWKVFYERTKPGAYATDVTKGTTPIYQEISNLNSAKSAYGNIVYQKAPSFLKQAEFYLGEKEFQEAVRLFLRHHAYSNADWSSLVLAFETTSKKDLSKWVDAWVKTRGVPIVRLKRSSYHSYQEMGQPHDTADIYSLAQEDALDEGGSWPLKTKVYLKFENNNTELIDVDLLEQSSKEGFAKYWVDIQSNPNFVPQDPVFVFPNYADHGYAIYLLDERSRRFAVKNIRDEKDVFLRSMMWGALWDSVRFAEMDPVEYIELALNNIDIETDETTISSILGRVRTAYTYYLSDTEQKTVSPKLEQLLMDKMSSAESNGQLLTYYRSYLSIGESRMAIKFLKALSSGDTAQGRDLPVKDGGSQLHSRLVKLLRAKDRFDIASRLIELKDSDALNILAELEKSETDDASKRDAYAARAAIATAENKKKYFDDFVSNKEISESWIEAGFDVWNTPSQSELTLPYLERALAELPNLKRDRKIFFVNGWLGAFIGGQKSEIALNIVQKFLLENSNLDADLKRKILERVDGLERGVRIRKKYS